MLRRGPVQIVVVVALGALVYFTGLGRGGLWATEGHRAIPGWTLLEHARGEVSTQRTAGVNPAVVPVMFERAYVRKPPGVAWATAAGSAVFGMNPFGARFVLASCGVALGVVAWWFVRRWVGPGTVAPLAAGTAQVLLPWLLESGRAAEIEPLNNLGTQIAVLAAADVFVRGGGVRSRGVMGVLVFVGAAVMLFAKGPASASVVASVVVFGGVAAWRAVGVRAATGRGGVVLAGLVAATACFGLWAAAADRAIAASGEAAVTQSPGEFLGGWGRPWEIAVLPLSAFAASLPLSLVVLFPFGPDWRREADAVCAHALGGGGVGSGNSGLMRLQRLLAIAWGVSIVGTMAAGVTNVRYAMPSSVLLAPLAGLVVWQVGSGLMGAVRARIGLVMVLGDGRAMVGVLLGVAAVWIGAVEPGRRGSSGTEAGVRLGEALAREAAEIDGGAADVVVFADGAVEARPETLWAMRAAAGNELVGRGVRVRWEPGLGRYGAVELAAAGWPVLVLRAEAGGETAGGIGSVAGYRVVARERVHKYEYSLLVRSGRRDKRSP